MAFKFSGVSSNSLKECSRFGLGRLSLLQQLLDLLIQSRAVR